VFSNQLVTLFLHWSFTTSLKKLESFEQELITYSLNNKNAILKSLESSQDDSLKHLTLGQLLDTIKTMPVERLFQIVQKSVLD